MMWWKRAQLEPQLYNTTLCDAAIGCETNSDKNFGVGLEANLSGIHLILHYK